MHAWNGGSSNTSRQLKALTNAAQHGSGSMCEEVAWLLFELEDTGVGITHDGLSALFKEYVQGTDDEMQRPRARGGTGLGLSICSKQARQGDGRRLMAQAHVMLCVCVCASCCCCGVRRNRMPVLMCKLLTARIQDWLRASS